MTTARHLPPGEEIEAAWRNVRAALHARRQRSPGRTRRPLPTGSRPTIEELPCSPS
ncbi:MULTISPECIES: hypothetical protein [unclassified Nocardioides]|uniref:hypothetical protein n=1 Tax=unclassified Nocardioides TaxID=2615069 RepID=UPI003606B5B4